MAGNGKRACGRLCLFLMVSVLTGCGAGGDPLSEGSFGEDLDSQTADKRRQPGGETRWVRTVRSAGGSDAPVAITHDRQDNVITVGNHLTPIDFGHGPLGTPSGTSVLVVSKYSPGGELLWIRLLEAPARAGVKPYVRAQALTADRQGNLFLTGQQSGGLDLGGGPLPAGAFLARLDPGGHPRWGRALPTSATELAVDTWGDITLSGVLSGQVDFGNGPVSGTGNPYLVQYGPEGRLRWVFVDSARGVPMDLAQDDTGDLYLAGGQFVPPSPLLTPFLTRISSEGKHRWTRRLDGASGLAMSVAAQGGQVVVSGYFTGSFVFRQERLSAPTSRGLVLAYERDGDERWGFLLGTTWGLVEMDQDAGMVVAGRYTGGEDFGLGLGALAGYPGATNLYMLRLQRPTGKLQWFHGYPSAATLPVDLSVSRHGEGALVGTFRAPVDLGTGPLTPGPGTNTFVLQLER
ncbi:hypothetical protein JRI60_03795 [Archangium violaceum]|uniref:hypothetical protein n=1 Tax=Archangium violaceum TaxID=83451 RepID=UPI00195245FA|nr:hypothetical protein [Archangium violaceum]QRN98203.1 hypothetical protein JRI60_03795 [Archangium violaceum]